MNKSDRKMIIRAAIDAWFERYHLRVWFICALGFFVLCGVIMIKLS